MVLLIDQREKSVIVGRLMGRLVVVVTPGHPT